MCRFVVFLAILVTLGCSSQPELDTATVSRLTQFRQSVQISQKDEEVLKALKELSSQIRDQHLSTVENVALREEFNMLRWPLARLLVERTQFDPAAHVIVAALTSDRDNRQYRMWKWWECNFGERSDYETLSRQITDALLHRFEKGQAAEKVVVAELFGKGTAEAKLPPDEFKKSIGYPGRRLPADQAQ